MEEKLFKESNIFENIAILLFCPLDFHAPK